jgi:hypothetical protein
MDKNIAQRGARHHCTVAISIETYGRKEYRVFQRIQSGRDRGSCGSHQCTKETSLVDDHLYICKHKKNIGSFEGKFSPKRPNFFIMAATIKKSLTTCIF